jgi:hypothetical protein
MGSLRRYKWPSPYQLEDLDTPAKVVFARQVTDTRLKDATRRDAMLNATATT